MDFSGAQTLMGTFKTFAIYAGAVICFGGLIFAGIRMMSGRFQDAIPGLFGALFGAGVLGWGAGAAGIATAYVDPVAKIPAQDEGLYAASALEMAAHGFGGHHVGIELPRFGRINGRADRADFA